MFAPIFVFVCLPVLGYLIGREVGRRAAIPPATPPRIEAEPDSEFQAKILDTLDALRREVSGLAERQDFTERLLGEVRRPPALRPPAEITPH